MKILVTFYSRTGSTKKVGEMIAKALKADFEEIFDTKKRKGIFGYFSAGKDASKKSLTKLKPLKSKIENYDLVVVGTPIWAWSISTPIRTFLSENKSKFKKLAFFSTRGGSEPEPVFNEMAEISKKPVCTLSFTTKQVMKENIEKQVNSFAKKIQSLK